MSKLTDQVQAKVEELLKIMDISASISVTEEEIDERNFVDVSIDAPENGAELIGKHGSLMEAIGTVVGMLLPKTEQRYSVLVDINKYRAERSKYLLDMADKAISQVVSSGQQIQLSPMKPWERRVVHMALVGRSDVVSESVGEEPDRKVIIKKAN